ncbi:uncharacterized protein VK521_001648 isoform 1-T3 [Ammospiza maritima maritima]
MLLYQVSSLHCPAKLLVRQTSATEKNTPLQEEADRNLKIFQGVGHLPFNQELWLGCILSHPWMMGATPCSFTVHHPFRGRKQSEPSINTDEMSPTGELWTCAVIYSYAIKKPCRIIQVERNLRRMSSKTVCCRGFSLLCPLEQAAEDFVKFRMSLQTQIPSSSQAPFAARRQQQQFHESRRSLVTGREEVQ